MNKIKYVSLFFRLLFQVSFISLITFQIIGWVYAPAPGSWLDVIPLAYHNYLPAQLAINTKIAGFFVTMVPVVIKLLVLYFLIKLFYLYERHEFFSVKNVNYIRYAGYFLLLLQLVKPLCEFLLGFVLTSSNPPGLRLAIATVTDANLGVILTALIIILISWIMSEGCKLNEEQQLTI